MLPIAVLQILLVLPPAFAAIAFFAISAWLYVRQVPLVLPGRGFAWLIALAMAPVLVVVVSLVLSASRSAACGSALFLVLIPVIVIFASWRSLRGYLVFGVTQDSTRDSLRSALDALELTFEETVLGFVLSPTRRTLRVQFQPWLATASFQLEGSDRLGVEAKIAEQVSEQLRLLRSGGWRGAASICGILGLVFLGAAIYQAVRF